MKRDNSVNTYSRISTLPRGSERSEWASLWMERVSRVSSVSEQTLRATEWPVQNAVVSDKKRPLMMLMLRLSWLSLANRCSFFGNSTIVFDKYSQNVFPMTTKNVFVPVERVISINTYPWFSSILQGSEQREYASSWTEQASKANVVQWSAAKQVRGVSSVSKWT